MRSFQLDLFKSDLLTSSQNYAGSTEVLHKIVFTQFRKIKVPHFLLFQAATFFKIAPSVALLFSSSSLFSFQGAIPASAGGGE